MSKASVSVSIGPGQHSFYILETLKKHYELKQSFQIYPDFVIGKYNNGIEISTTQIKFYRSLQRAVWGLWLRLPVLKTSQIPKVFLYNLADNLIKKKLRRMLLIHSMVSNKPSKH